MAVPLSSFAINPDLSALSAAERQRSAGLDKLESEAGLARIGLARRGFSTSGGAEAYLKRLGRSLNEAGFRPTLYATRDWPSSEWPYGNILHLEGNAPTQFADAIQKCRDTREILFSLERIWSCHCYRAGDGVHRVWLQRRTLHESFWKRKFRFLNSKHRQILKLEDSLFRWQRAQRVIANSQMVKDEIVAEYQYPADRITVVYNGLPAFRLQDKPASREMIRKSWAVRDDDVILLFAGSGWERKGLRYAIQAVDDLIDSKIKLIVAGAGRKNRLKSSRTRFLGAVEDMAAVYAGADLFILPTVYDPFSNACLEALAFGLPVITTNTNGFAEIITPGVHGEVVQSPDDIKGLSSAILAWQDAEKRREARTACSELASLFTMERNLNETLQVLLAR